MKMVQDNSIWQSLDNVDENLNSVIPTELYNYTFPQDGQVIVNPVHICVNCALIVTIFATGIIGNILLLAACYLTLLRRRPDPTIWLVASLGVSDILSCLVVLPANLYTYYYQEWTFHPTLCRLVGMLTYALQATAVFTICLIAWSRYTRARTFCSHHSKQTKIIKLQILFSWILPIITFLPTFTGLLGDITFIPQLATCNLSLDLVGFSYRLSFQMLRGPVTGFVVVYCYYRIYSIAIQSKRRLRARSMMPQKHSSKVCRHRQVQRVTTAIIAAFALSYMPCVVVAGYELAHVLPTTYQLYCQVSAFVGCTFNPIVYGFMNTQLRKSFRRMIRRNRKTTCCLHPL